MANNTVEQYQINQRLNSLADEVANKNGGYVALVLLKTFYKGQFVELKQKVYFMPARNEYEITLDNKVIYFTDELGLAVMRYEGVTR